jgi:hypothetical protein
MRAGMFSKEMTLKFSPSSSRRCFPLVQLYCDGRGVAHSVQQPRIRRRSINVTLKKRVDWVELNVDQLQVSTHRLAREPVSKK